MEQPSEATMKAANENSMRVLGINSSAFFNTEAVMLTHERLSERYKSTAYDPILVTLDGARPHIATEVCNFFFLMLFSLFSMF